SGIYGRESALGRRARTARSRPRGESAARSGEVVDRVTAKAWVVLAAALVAEGCALSPPKGSRSISTEPPKRRPNTKSVLVLLPDSTSAKAALSGLRQEIGEDFDVIPKIVNEDTAPRDVEKAMREAEPSVVVLMNNPTVRLYRNFQLLGSPQRKAIPSVA